MRKKCSVLGMCLLAAGVGILLSCFLPTMVLVCIEAVLLICAGLLLLF